MDNFEIKLLEFAHCSLINLTYAKYKVTFFIMHFFISPILYEGRTLINFGFLIKEDLIRGFTENSGISITARIL